MEVNANGIAEWIDAVLTLWADIIATIALIVTIRQGKKKPPHRQPRTRNRRKGR